MVKVLVLLSLALTQVARLVLADVQIDDLFYVQPGNASFGGCSVYNGLLEVWHQECIYSVYTAMDVIERYYYQRSPEGEIVRKALYTWLKIRTDLPRDTRRRKAPVSDAHDKFRHLWNYFEGRTIDVDSTNTFLFCSAGWLVEKSPSDDAQDYLGDVIMNDDGAVPIGAVPDYVEKLGLGNVPWWAGHHTELHGYHITSTDSGGNYCNEGNLGQTSTMDALQDTATVLTGHKVNTVIICPLAFDSTMKREQYAEAAADDLEGHNLHDALPKSATLLHEAIHVLFGADDRGITGMAEGEQETYGLAECAALNAKEARRNPENYVYLAAALHYYFADRDSGINTNWNFVDDWTSGRLGRRT